MLIDFQTFKLLKSAIDKDGWIQLPSYGKSMFPFILQGDVCRFEPCNPITLKKGEIVLFCSSNGMLIAHRFYKTIIDDNNVLFLFKGDTNLGLDQPIELSRIIGRLVKIYRNEKEISPKSLFSILWGKMVLEIPLLSALIRRYINKRMRLQF